MVVEPGLKTCKTPNQQTREAREERGDAGDFQSLVSPAIGQKEGQIHEGRQNILGEIDRHIVSGVFTDEIFKQQPGDKAVDAVPPVSQDREGESSGDADHRHQRKADDVVVENQSGELIRAEEGDGEKPDPQDLAGTLGFLAGSIAGRQLSPCSLKSKAVVVAQHGITRENGSDQGQRNRERLSCELITLGREQLVLCHPQTSLRQELATQ